MIPVEILESYNCSKKEVPAGTFLFMEGENAHFYYQIISGKVKMVNTNEEGKEFVQGTFEDGQSFGEPPLFQDREYPASAFTEVNTVLYSLPKDVFFTLLKENFEIHLKFTSILTKRLMYKAMMLREASNHDAKHRILALIDYMKSEFGEPDQAFEVNLTRQQLSEMLGIRVETVIRTVKQLKEAGDVELIDRKIFR